LESFSERSGFALRLREWRDGFFIGVAMDSLLNHLVDNRKRGISRSISADASRRLSLCREIE
jgi:hypothetical protein